jgi:hypothetical protein
MTESLIEIVRGINEVYGVNLFVFALLYFTTIPLFWASLGKLVRNIRRRQPLLWPTVGVAISQIACYLYLFIDGEGLPRWIYFAAFALIFIGAYKSWLYITTKLKLREVYYK